MIWYFSGLEKFVVRGYTKSGMKANKIADLRWWLFSKYTTEVAKLPPTLSALKHRIFRSHYVAFVLTDDLPAPTGLIELSMCSCKSPCQTDRCMCRKNKLLCTEMCKCVDTCENCDNDGTEY